MSSLGVTSLVLMCSSVLVLAGSSCPPGFLLFQESCYWFSSIEANFAEARSYCGFLKSRLAVITSKEEDDFVREKAKERKSFYYAGATDLGKKGIWRWEGGLEMTWTNWRPGEPNNIPQTGGVEHCLVCPPDAWNDIICSQKAHFICERCVLN